MACSGAPCRYPSSSCTVIDGGCEQSTSRSVINLEVREGASTIEIGNCTF